MRDTIHPNNKEAVGWWYISQDAVWHRGLKTQAPCHRLLLRTSDPSPTLVHSTPRLATSLFERSIQFITSLLT